MLIDFGNKSKCKIASIWSRLGERRCARKAIENYSVTVDRAPKLLFVRWTKCYSAITDIFNVKNEHKVHYKSSNLFDELYKRITFNIFNNF